MSYKKVIEGDDDYFEYLGSPGNLYKKAPKLVPITDAERGITPAQRRTVEDVTQLFPIMDFSIISAETVRFLEEANEARKTVKNLKGDLSGKIKMAIFVAMSAVQQMAERSVIIPTQEMANLRKENISLKKRMKDLENRI